MVKISIIDSNIKLDCMAGVASDIIYFFNKVDCEVLEKEGNCEIILSVKYIEDVRLFTKEYRRKTNIIIDNSVHEWIEYNKVNRPLYIKVYPTECIIYRSSTTEIPHNAIDEICKYFFKPAVNMKSYKDNRWDGYYHLYNKKTRRFPTGLLPDVKKLLESKNIRAIVEFMYDKSPKKEFQWRAKKLFVPSDDQLEAIEVCKKKKRCVVKAATGFGKTSCLARYLTAEFSVPTLFIANKKVLLDDAAEDFGTGIEGLSMDNVSQIKDGRFGNVNLRKKFTEEDIQCAFNGKYVVVATIQSLDARLKDPNTSPILKKWLSQTCKFLMIDETQAVGTKIWDDVLKHVAAPYRVFLSATPKRTDGATLKLFAYSGPLAFDTSADEQIRKGRLCEIDIYYKPYDHMLYNDNDKSLNYQEVYADNIVNNDDRNSFIINETLEMLKEERQVLILIQFIDHGNIIHAKLLQAGLKTDEVKFIYGETPDKIRQETINNFRDGRGKVLIGSTIADVGMNIPSLSGVILCGAGNSDITHIQRIGRGSRNFDYIKYWGHSPKFLKNNNMVKVTKVIDILDTNIAFFNKQAKNRYYNACNEFGTNRVHLVSVDKSIFNRKKKNTASYTSKIEQDDFIEGLEIFRKHEENMKDEFKNKNITNFVDDF